MLHPSYVEMIDRINEENDREEAPLVTSRYSVVLASAKRARQIIAGAEPYEEAYTKDGAARKALSVAVDELYSGKVNILAKEKPVDEDLTEV